MAPPAVSTIRSCTSPTFLFSSFMMFAPISVLARRALGAAVGTTTLVVGGDATDGAAGAGVVLVCAKAKLGTASSVAVNRARLMDELNMTFRPFDPNVDLYVGTSHNA
ncbi:hypothetical protein GCM10011320_39560 [Neoroseomonas lacus]|uniref:Uncharacterized protein n=1 Tax=Neoroseomonas lacus TaxID=287609 RepID=A0A917NU48_9PROT|nr:hypothetical protein GCM10011320_39560 [Neoroseomonas lacus]